MKIIQLNILNKETEIIKSGKLFYDKIKKNCYLKIEFDTMVEEVYATDYFKALKKIRKKIYPWIPMVNGSLIDAYPSSMSRDMSNATVLYGNNVLGKPAKTNDQLFIFDKNEQIEKLVHFKTQDAYHEIWFNSIGKQEDGFSSNEVIIEKVPKYAYMNNSKENRIDKVLNKNYQYFWVFDKNNNQVYDIKNQDDIQLYQARKILPRWNNLNDFVEWYADNLLVRKR